MAHNVLLVLIHVQTERLANTDQTDVNNYKTRKLHIRHPVMIASLQIHKHHMAQDVFMVLTSVQMER